MLVRVVRQLNAALPLPDQGHQWRSKGDKEASSPSHSLDVTSIYAEAVLIHFYHFAHIITQCYAMSPARTLSSLAPGARTP